MYMVRSEYIKITKDVRSLIHSEETSYIWITPYKTKKEANKAAAYLRKASTATKVEVLKKETKQCQKKITTS